MIEDVLLPEVKTLEDSKQYLKDRCYFRFLIEEDVIKRGQIEGVLSYVLNIRYMHEEH